MHTLLQDVLPWALAFVVLDALVQLRVGQILVVRTWPAAARVLGPGVHVAGAWPHADVVPVHELPFLPAPEGAWFRDPAARCALPVIVPDELTFVCWAQLAGVRAEGRRVVADGRTLVKALSAAGASRIAEELKALAHAGTRRADVLLAHVEGAFDPRPLRDVRAKTRPLRVALAVVGAAWCGLLVAILPLVAWTRAAAPILPILLVGLGLAVAAAVLAALTLRRAGFSWSTALGRVGPILLFPPFAARALPNASKEAQLFLDPLAVVAVVASPRDLAAACRRELVRIRNTRTSTASLGLEEYWAIRERAIRALARRESIASDQLEALPPHDAGAMCVCPLCESSYRIARASCCECGIPLVAVPRERPSPGERRRAGGRS
jgi:hypothetical protein